MLKAIVTGANGFIGQHLLEELKKKDITPIAFPRTMLYAGVPDIAKYLFDIHPDYIFHLASYGNHSTQKDDTQAIMANYFSTYNLLKATEFYDYKAFINIATSSMYGQSDKPMAETDQFKPDTFYSATKTGGLYLAHTYAKQYNKPIVSAIPFSVYGEGEADFRFIPTVCRSLIKDEPMKLDLYANHDWIYVKDFIKGLFTLVENVDNLGGSWVNIGTGTMWTNAEIVHMLEGYAGRKLKIEGEYDKRPNDATAWQADNTLLKGLGWKTETSIGKGLRECWDYYKMKYD